MDLNDGGRIIEICFKDCVIDAIDNFGVSDAIDEIPVGGECKLDYGPA